MPFTLILPGVSHPAPATPDTRLISISAPDNPPATLAAAMRRLPSEDADTVLGAPTTPALLWLAATLRWPNARLLLQEDTEAGPAWRDIRGNELLTVSVPEAPAEEELEEESWSELEEPESAGDGVTTPEAEAHISDIPEPAPLPSPRPKAGAKPFAPTTATLDAADQELVQQIFRVSTWQRDHETRGKLESLRRQVVDRNNRVLTQLAWSANRDGNQAHYQIQLMEDYLRKQGPDEAFKQWLAQLTDNYPSRVVSVIKLKFKKWEEFQKAKRARQAEGGWKKPQSLIPPLKLKGRPHPNSLRHLPPHDRWDILVDESGEAFEVTPGANPGSMGRIVALAIPVGKADLPPLKPGFHANKETDETIDLALKAVLAAPVGVLGITTRDPLAGRSPRWFTSIYHLLHLLFRLLPLTPGKPAVVRVCIEQRGGVMAGADTSLIEQMLKHELDSLDDARFAGLQLEIKVVDKNGHPANGYCDAVAHCWGGKNRERLKRTAFAGNCFLSPDEASLERLFAALDGLEVLEPADWYRLAAVLAHEPEHSLAHGMMRQLGEKVRLQPELWRRYLDEVQGRLLRKNYRLPELAATLGWLDAWKPEDTALPKRLQLHWHTASLAAANHFGQVDLDRIGQCLQLGQALWDEAAPEVCQSALRIAVACTNAFEFDNARAVLAQWSDQPSAVCGLLNRGKLLSSLGQVNAFEGDPVRAVTLFDEALAHFARLSNPAKAERESAQTRIYRLIASMDRPATAAAALEEPFKQHFGASLAKTAAALALSGEDRRFEQHVLLRALVQYPELREAREAYLRHAEEWQLGEGHPWALIHAWRGWLLWDAGRKKEAGSAFRLAVSLCRTEDNGPILFWMGEVLASLATRLGLDTVQPDAEIRATLTSLLPHAPHERLAEFADGTTDPRATLAACLPFNFR